MIYLGEQNETRIMYSQKAYCYLNKKLFGSYSKDNKEGYKCKLDVCDICSKGFHQLSLGVFKNFIKPYLFEILNVQPKDMLALEGKLILNWIQQGYGSCVEFQNNCKAIFLKGYNTWFINYSINYELAEWLDQHTCSFCNRQYIFTARKNAGAKGITCQFDHWLSKSKHPLFSLSFYNLIPCCSVCNSSIKSTEKFNTNTHLHPYVDKHISNSFSFSYKLNAQSEYEIDFANENHISKKAKKTLEDLGTKLVYSKHSQTELKDLIDLRLKYNENYLQSLLEKTFGDLNMSDEERYRLIFGIEIDEKDYHKRPMSKFKKDIITELLSIK
ncbi:hypothetical protein DSM03_104167 [Leeuwenhoekiella aestuarii]|uniref:hypothetical protein n=1 Tax=Leeuwenhoekiella aestuarii TaxID=2249426 RepID=UPI000FFE5A89|nr:hypothetical protein [Leeuwenhoekiella aestuarii]RXG15009.1 hypothetical protein DSM03_104167 [Leeuwenhoekiella aestuarii]